MDAVSSSFESSLFSFQMSFIFLFVWVPGVPITTEIDRYHRDIEKNERERERDRKNGMRTIDDRVI